MFTTQARLYIKILICSIQFNCSVVSDSLRPHESQHTRPPCPSPTPGSSLRLTSIESVMPSSHLILCHPLLLPPIPPSIKVFSNESTLRMRWPKYWSFSFSIILLASTYSPCFGHSQSFFPMLSKPLTMPFSTLGLVSQGIGCCCRLSVGGDYCFPMKQRERGAR